MGLTKFVLTRFDCTNSADMQHEATTQSNNEVYEGSDDKIL